MTRGIAVLCIPLMKINQNLTGESCYIYIQPLSPKHQAKFYQYLSPVIAKLCTWDNSDLSHFTYSHFAYFHFAYWNSNCAILPTQLKTIFLLTPIDFFFLLFFVVSLIFGVCDRYFMMLGGMHIIVYWFTMEFVTTTRAGRSLIYEGYKYVLNWQGRNVQRAEVVVEDWQ